jgi:phospholipase/carboxylesterase/glyoxalase family protein
MDPHGGLPVISIGPAPGAGDGVVIMIHGRGAGPQNILSLVPALARPSFTYLAPTAADATWYPNTFMNPFEDNEPKLSSALRSVSRLVDEVVAFGVSPDRIVLLGFSQGACLAGEYACRHPRRYGGVAMLSGGLIGPPGTQWNTPGHFHGTPVFLGCSDRDSHIPKARVHESAEVFRRMGARVTEHLYPNMGHLVSDEEVVEVRALLDNLRSPATV